jgi:soluble epoxide hydrolase / lipid-phosphate phosphatase
MKRAAHDIAALAGKLGASRIILGGHDWGGAIVYRVALWYPDLIAAIFSVCTPYTPPSSKFNSTEDIVKTLPQFGYQLHLASGELEENIQGKEKLRQFLNGMYGGKSSNGGMIFDPKTGINFSLLGSLEKTPLVRDEVGILTGR